MKNKLFIFLLFFIFLVTSGFGCRLVSQGTKEAMEPITLNYWRVWDGPDAFAEIIANYNKLHPFITIEYRKLRYNEYEKELLEALAEDRGPDILSIHNTWIKKYQNKLAPMPAEITMAYPITKGTIKKEVIPELRTVASISLKDIKSKFIDTVYKDAVVDVQGEDKGTIKKEVFGLPLAVDTLALYYNNDLLNNAGIAEPSIYWNREFQLAVKSLTKQDAKGQIIQSGVALGGSANIERYSDILSVLMMQNGAEMINDAGQVVFDKIPASLREQKYNPGLEALRFYTDFSNPAKEVYAWNNSLDNSLEMFIQGKLAMFFGYAYHLPTISARAPKLNFSISKLPQIEGNLQRVDFANYWVETVSNKSKYINEAWDFIQFATTNPDQTRLYLAVAKKSTALRSIINEQISDMEVGVFAEQALTAKSWYRGEDFNAAELIIGEMINDMAKAEKKPEEIISLGAKRIEQTIED